MGKFDFTDHHAAWKSISGKKWELPLINGDEVHLSHKGEYRAFNFDGKVLNDKGEPIPGHLDNILGGWTEPFARRPITESVTEVVEEADVPGTDDLVRRSNEGPTLAGGGLYSLDRYSEMVERTFEELRKLAALKGGEYSGDVDRLANFRRNGLDLGLPMEVIWRVYAAKHWDAVGQYIRDLHTGKERVRLESISGRVDDLLVYLLLFKAMIEERENGQS